MEEGPPCHARKPQVVETGTTGRVAQLVDRTRRPGARSTDGRCGWEEASACQISRALADTADRSRTRVQGEARLMHISGPTPSDRSTRTSRCPWAREVRSSSSMTNCTGPGEVDHQGRRPGPGARPGPPGARAPGPACASGFQRVRLAVPVNASSAVRPSWPCHQHGGHVAGLVVRQALLVVLHLAEHRDDRHQHAASCSTARVAGCGSAASPGGPRRTPPARRSPRGRRRRRRRRSPDREGCASQGSFQTYVGWTHAPGRVTSPSTPPRGPRSPSC